MTDEDAARRERFPRRTIRRQETRARIMKAARRLFRQIGFGSATMAAIADAADVHVTTLFNHFKTKRELAASLNDAQIETMERMIAEAKGVTPFFDFFRAMVLDSVHAIKGETDPNLTLWSELKKDPELTMIWIDYERRQIELLADLAASEFGLDAEKDYTPRIVSSILLSAAWDAHRRWSAAFTELNLEDETLKAIAIAEKMARAALPAAAKPAGRRQPSPA